MGVINKSDNKLVVVLVISLLLIGLVILSNILSFQKIEQLYTNQVVDGQIVETDHVANQVENHILRVKDELVTLSKFPIMDSINISQCSGSMKIIHQDINGLISSLLRADSSGQVLECSNSEFSNYVGLNIKDKEYFYIPKETSEPYISDVMQQGTSGHVMISTPLYQTSQYTPYPNYEGNFKGIIFSIIDLETLFNLYIHPAFEDNVHLFLLINSQNNNTILESEELRNYTILLKDLAENQDKIIRDLDYYGKTIVTMSDIKFGSENWRLIVLTPLDRINKNFSSVQRRHLMSLLFVLLVLILALVGYVRLYKSKEKIKNKLNKTNLTLEKFGINIQTEEQTYTQADIKLESKKIYFIREDAEGQAYDLFISCLNEGKAGLGIIRENPELIKKRYGLKNTSFIWLSKDKSSDIPSEVDIENISRLMNEFLNKSISSVILIDRLDYLYAMNGSSSVNKVVFEAKDIISSKDAIIILAANSKLLKASDMDILNAETIDLFGSHLKKSVNLTEQELKMLSFINERNIENRLVSYKDITSNFNITKPTTRAKIAHLQRLNLIMIEPRGRFKSIKITSLGRSMLH